jgi:hypothetical protein
MELSNTPPYTFSSLRLLYEVLVERFILVFKKIPAITIDGDIQSIHDNSSCKN